MGVKARLKKDAKEIQSRLNEQIDLYTIKEAADVLRVHSATIRNWIKAGKIKFVTLGPANDSKRKAYRIEREELKRMIQ